MRTTQVELTMPDDATARDLLTRLVEMYGDPFVERVLTSDGRPQTYAQLFVDGSPVDRENLDVRLSANGAAAEVLFYVLLLAEGG
ncbi:MAG: MoaD/ThiS family protein [Chloroflexi bacterium]|nr:MoaD/ThiS family protein [Chloroflexota bacterium]